METKIAPEVCREVYKGGRLRSVFLVNWGSKTVRVLRLYLKSRLTRSHKGFSFGRSGSLP